MKRTSPFHYHSLALVACLTLAATTAADANRASKKNVEVAAAAQAEKSAPTSLSQSNSASEKPSIKLEGFRSARFGMTEKEVRRAIKKDFKVQDKEITSETNKQERTKILNLDVKDLLPGGGKSKVSYVFGYKSNKLIQVSTVWSKATDDTLTPAQLFSNANVLQTYFADAGYDRSSMAMNLPANGGLIMFRGNDAEKRTTLLMLQGNYTAGKDNSRVLTPASLMLFYVKDAEQPDVYRLPKGLF